MTAEKSPYDEKLGSILSAAAQIFSAKGYHNASIRDIARATEVSLSGLYYYFQSKEELLYLIQDHALGTLLDRVEESLEGVSCPETRLRILIEKHGQALARGEPALLVLRVDPRLSAAEPRGFAPLLKFFDRGRHGATDRIEHARGVRAAEQGRQDCDGDDTTDERRRPSSETTAAAVSSHDVSMPRITTRRGWTSARAT